MTDVERDEDNTLDRRTLLRWALATGGAAMAAPVIMATPAGAAPSTSHTLVRFEYTSDYAPSSSLVTWTKVTPTATSCASGSCVPSRWCDATDAPGTATVTGGGSNQPIAITVAGGSGTFLVDTPFVDLTGEVQAVVFETDQCIQGSGTANGASGSVPAAPPVASGFGYKRLRFVVATA